MPNALGLLADPRGEMRATPRNKLMGLLADALTAFRGQFRSSGPNSGGIVRVRPYTHTLESCGGFAGL
jgi:hypothetical protein